MYLVREGGKEGEMEKWYNAMAKYCVYIADPRPPRPPYFLSSSPLLLPPAAHDNDRLRIYLANKRAGCRARARTRKSDGDDVEQCMQLYKQDPITRVIPGGRLIIHSLRLQQYLAALSVRRVA